MTKAENKQWLRAYENTFKKKNKQKKTQLMTIEKGIDHSHLPQNIIYE